MTAVSKNKPKLAVAVAALLLPLLLASSRAESASLGDLYQPSPFCIKDLDASINSCTNNVGIGISSVTSAVFSPDGNHLYTSGTLSSAVALFSRNETTNELTQSSTAAEACIADISTTTSSCTNRVGIGITGPNDLVISPDGKHLYLQGSGGKVIAVLTRDADSGVLTQSSTMSEACIGDTTATTSNCTNLTGGSTLNTISDLAISPDGKNVYAVAINRHAVTVFDRNATTGALTLNTTTPCLGDTSTASCAANIAIGLSQPTGVTVSPDGKNVYVAGSNSDAIANLVRDTTTGALSQSGTVSEACIADSAATSSTCTNNIGEALNGVRDITVSNDGRDLYAVSAVDDSVTSFTRNSTTGRLIQRAGTSGCISDKDSTSSSVCINNTGLGLEGANTITISPDDKTVYTTAATSEALAAFDRHPTSRTLTQKSGTSGCIIDTEGTPGSCTNNSGIGIRGLQSVAVSPDSLQLVSAASSNALGIFALARPIVQLSAADIGLSEVTIGGSSTQQLIVTNSGMSDLTLSATTLNGTDAGSFLITGNSCLGSPLTAAASCMIDIAFSPTAAGDYSANLEITNDSLEGTINVGLTGRGVAPIVPPVTPPATTTTTPTTTAQTGGTSTGGGGSATTTSVLSISKKVAKTSRKGVTKLKLSCKAASNKSCSGKLTLKKGKRTIGRTISFKVRGGKTVTVKHKLAKRYLKLLKKQRRFSVTVTVKPNSGTTVKTATTKLKLRF